MRFLLLLLPLLLVAQAPPAATGPRLDASKTLFTVMTALNLSGLDTGMDSPNASPLRKAVREFFKDKKLASLKELQQYFQEHRKPDTASDLSQYISFALAMQEPPAFEPKFRADEPLPPDVEQLGGLPPLLMRFWQEAKLEEIWPQVEPYYEQQLSTLQEPLIRVIRDVDGYLRHVEASNNRRRFIVYVEPLMPPSQFHVRSYREEVLVVLSPSAEPPIDRIRAAYISYVIDPIAFRNEKNVNRLRGLREYADLAPLLDPAMKADFQFLATKSLALAIDARLTKPKSRGPEIVQQALEEGFIFTPAFWDALPAYEKQEASFRIHFPAMVDGIDLAKEEARLEKVQFAKTRKPGALITPAQPAPVEPVRSAIEQSLDRAESLLRENRPKDAETVFREVLTKVDEKSSHARAYYGLGRILFFQRQDPEVVEKTFLKVLELNPDPATRAWTNLHLGLVHRALGENEDATKWFQDAAAVPGAPAAAIQRANQELARKPAN